jgi:preprotein translocase subunit SecE
MTKHRKNKPGSNVAGQAGNGVNAAEAEAKVSIAKDKPQAPPPPRLKSKKEDAEVKPPSWPFRLLNFFREAKKELSRVTWPTRKETVKSTGVLLVLVAISAAYLGLVDSFLSWVLRLLVG